ncbi:MAG: citrate lyase subunit alpha, partial [Cloacibacillus porcorum]
MKNVTNSLNRIVPAEIAGVGSFAPYRSPFSTIAALGGRMRPASPIKAAVPSRDKVVPSLRAAVERSGLCDGMTISFHHHLR